MKPLYVVLAIMVSLLSSCAGVKLYSDSNLSQRTALEMHYAKPFLFVPRNPNDSTRTVQIVYLPDLTKTAYAKQVRGLGAANLQVKLTNGYLDSYGLEQDSKIPETITAVTGVLTAVLGAAAKSAPRASGMAETSIGDSLWVVYALEANSDTTMIFRQVSFKK